MENTHRLCATGLSAETHAPEQLARGMETQQDRSRGQEGVTGLAEVLGQAEGPRSGVYSPPCARAHSWLMMPQAVTLRNYTCLGSPCATYPWTRLIQAMWWVLQDTGCPAIPHL